jgi:two-component system, OmpR family, phosphate regulon sensor histidine kinase PhoR
MPTPPRPFLARLIVPFAVLMALIVVVCGLTIHWAGERATRRQQIQDLNRLTALFRQWVVPATPAPGSDAPAALDAEAHRRLVDAAGVLDTRVTLIDGSGRVLFDTDASAERMENHNARPEVVAARREGVGSSVRYSGSVNEQSVYVAQILDPARPDGQVLRLSYRQHTWADLGYSAWPVVTGGIVAALLAALLLWAIILRQWINPTRTLAEAAERMAEGQWDRRVTPAGADELRSFSTRLNLVASHAQRQLADLKGQQADLQALVDALPDPILVSDAAGKVVLINPPAARLLDLSRSRALGEAVVNVVNDEAVLQLFDKVREAQRQGAPEPRPSDGIPFPPDLLTREVRLNRDGQWLTYQAVGTRTAGGGVLLVLRDVTALAATVRMKEDFVANASHELRTPIAAIKIAFETLREVYGDDPVQATRCMQIIEGHMARLEEMLRDLLDLSKVESASLKPHVRSVKSTDLFAQVRSALGPMARQKGVELRLGGPSQPDFFYADERLLNLVLKNLVENSIKFTPAAGTVTCDVGHGEAERSVVLRVTDSGIGIPPEHLERVFERFYQVDPARSGSAGRGTGLGLAIVKHAIAALGGTVQIDSVVGKGTTVTCVLPQPAEESAADERRVTRLRA